MYVELLGYLQSVAVNLGSDSRIYRESLAAWKQHPNMRAYKDHLGVTRLCTPDVNPDVDVMDITHRSEAGSLEIMPFLQNGAIRLYADPPIYVVGYRNPYGFGECPLVDWRELLEDAGIGPEVCGKVNRYLRSHQPVNYEDVP